MPGSPAKSGGHAARLGIDPPPSHPAPFPDPAPDPAEERHGLKQFQNRFHASSGTGVTSLDRRPDSGDGECPDRNNTWDPSRNALIRTAEEAEAFIANTLAQLVAQAASPPAGLDPSTPRREGPSSPSPVGPGSPGDRSHE
jgi:hypothetical protein